MMPDKGIALTIFFTDALFDRLAAAAKRRGKSVDEMAKQLILIALAEVEA